MAIMNTGFSAEYKA